MKFILWAEGYKSEDPNDPGGRTILGYCERDHPKEVALLWDMPRKEAEKQVEAFYFKDYWIPAGCDDLSSPMDIVIMDIAINQGVSRAKTVALCAANWWDALLLRSDLYDDLKLYSTYGKSWNKRRVVALRDYITSGYEVLEDDRKTLLSADKEIKDTSISKTENKAEMLRDIFVRVLIGLFKQFTRKVNDEKQI
jgi:lysozyme family protein